MDSNQPQIERRARDREKEYRSLLRVYWVITSEIGSSSQMRLYPSFTSKKLKSSQAQKEACLRRKGSLWIKFKSGEALTQKSTCPMAFNTNKLFESWSPVMMIKCIIFIQLRKVRQSQKIIKRTSQRRVKIKPWKKVRKALWTNLRASIHQQNPPKIKPWTNR